MADHELENPEPGPTEMDRTMPLPRGDSSQAKIENTLERLANAETAEDLRQQPVEQTLQLSGDALSKLLTGSGPAPSKASAAAPKSNLPASGTRFHILRPWREGGLGKVSIARDEELHREVALKEIKPQHASSKNNQSRFLIEGEITGSLEHPGIVPVYGMGRYADGRPYYAMRFVHGESFEEAIAHFHKSDSKTKHGQRTVEFRELINRFIAVCNAMAYAHSRGVIHRDLKPANILLAKYGETLVVDWGLAKVAGQADDLVESPNESMLSLQSGAGSTATRLGSVIGTPAYMSPEQAEGRQDLMNPATDIYSLGATLYCLLTGVSPFTATHLSEVLDKVKRGDFKPPRELVPKLPRALDAICRKAMALKREDRYKTAGDLALDLQHWLADEPVTAYPEGPRERAVRWLRRHRSLALATAIALAVVTGVSIVATALINHQRVIANEARESADVAFHEARDAVDELFTKVSEDALLNQPGMQVLRTELLQKTLNYYERFLQQRANDATVKEEIGMTLFRAGRIIDELQSPESAVPKLQQAVAIQKELLAEKPDDVNRLQALGDSHNALGRSLHRGQQLDEASAAYDAGRRLREQLATLSPQNADYQRALANSLMNLGLVEQDRGKLEAALEQLQTAQKIRDNLARAGEIDSKLQRDLAMGAYNLGNLAVARQQLNEAAKHYSTAIAGFQKLKDDDPRDLRIQFLLATSFRRAGDALATFAPEEAGNMYELAREGFAQLADRNPEVGEYQAALAGIYMNIGFRQELGAAVASFEKAESILNKLVQQYPQNRRFRRDFAMTLRELAIKQLAAGQRETGLKNLRRSVDDLETLVKEVPQDESLQKELNTSREALEAAMATPAQTETV